MDSRKFGSRMSPFLLQRLHDARLREFSRPYWRLLLFENFHLPDSPSLRICSGYQDHHRLTVSRNHKLRRQKHFTPSFPNRYRRVVVQTAGAIRIGVATSLIRPFHSVEVKHFFVSNCHSFPIDSVADEANGVSFSGELKR